MQFGIANTISKVSSFYDYENYFIYDARAIFALKLTLLKYESPNISADLYSCDALNMKYKPPKKQGAMD